MVKYEVSELFKEYEGVIKNSIRNSNEITFTLEETKPWESKLGGCPYLENIKEYPTDKHGKPMMFLAQINLEDLVQLDNMPQKGIIQFFIKSDTCYGYSGTCKVRYIQEYIKDESKLILKNPYEEDYTHLLPFQKNGKMQFQLREMPMPCCLEKFDDLFQGATLSNDQENKIWDDFDASGSRVGGYPYFVQADPEYFNEYNVLLLQLDIENTCGIMFGDAGNCNFLIKEEDLKNRDFSDVKYDWQCC